MQAWRNWQQKPQPSLWSNKLKDQVRHSGLYAFKGTDEEAENEPPDLEEELDGLSDEPEPEDKEDIYSAATNAGNAKGMSGATAGMSGAGGMSRAAAGMSGAGGMSRAAAGMPGAGGMSGAAAGMSGAGGMSRAAAGMPGAGGMSGAAAGMSGAGGMSRAVAGTSGAGGMYGAGGTHELGARGGQSDASIVPQDLGGRWVPVGPDTVRRTATGSRKVQPRPVSGGPQMMSQIPAAQLGQQSFNLAAGTPPVAASSSADTEHNNSWLNIQTTGVGGLHTASKDRNIHGSIVDMNPPIRGQHAGPSGVDPRGQQLVRPAPATNRPPQAETGMQRNNLDMSLSGDERMHSGTRHDSGKSKVIETSWESSDDPPVPQGTSISDPRGSNIRSRVYHPSQRQFSHDLQYMVPVNDGTPRDRYGRPLSRDPRLYSQQQREPQQVYVPYDRGVLVDKYGRPLAPAPIPYDPNVQPLYSTVPPAAPPHYGDRYTPMRPAAPSAYGHQGFPSTWGPRPAMYDNTLSTSGLPATQVLYDAMGRPVPVPVSAVGPSAFPTAPHTVPQATHFNTAGSPHRIPPEQIYPNHMIPSEQAYSNHRIPPELPHSNVPRSSQHQPTYSASLHYPGVQRGAPESRYPPSMPQPRPQHGGMNPPHYNSQPYGQQVRAAVNVRQHEQEPFPSSNQHVAGHHNQYAEASRYSGQVAPEPLPASGRFYPPPSDTDPQPELSTSSGSHHQPHVPPAARPAASVPTASSRSELLAHGSGEVALTSHSHLGQEDTRLTSAHGHVLPSSSSSSVHSSRDSRIAASLPSSHPKARQPHPSVTTGPVVTAGAGLPAHKPATTRIADPDEQLTVLGGVRPMPPLLQDPQLQDRVDSLRSSQRSLHSSASTDLYGPGSVPPATLGDFHYDEQKGEESVKCLVSAAHCKVDHCRDDEHCQKGKGLFSKLTNLERGHHHESSDEDKSSMVEWKRENQDLLHAIWLHAGNCPELLCTIPFCLVFNETDDKEFEHLMAELKVRYFTAIHIFSSEDNEKYVPLTIGQENRLFENVDWEGVTRMGHFSDTFLARRPRLSDGPTVELWTITKVYLHNSDEYRNNLESVLGKLHNNPCNQVITHLWYVAQESHLYICTRYEGEYHPVSEGDQDVGDVVLWYNQLQKAINFLHGQHILYLNWKTSTVLIRKDYRLVKLLNFTCAVDLDISDLDEHLYNLPMFLHPLIIPPEVLEVSDLQCATDYWGLGCLVYELLTGHKVHHKLRHHSPEEIRASLMDEPSVDLSEIQDVEMKGLLQQCFQVNPSERHPPRELEERQAVPRETNPSPPQVMSTPIVPATQKLSSPYSTMNSDDELQISDED